jgi:hypothetical protein
MSELRRWIVSDAPPDIERMLRAAQADSPKGTLVDRTLAACGAGAVAAGLTHTATAAGVAHGTAAAGKALGAAAGHAATGVGAATLGASAASPAVGGVTSAIVKWTVIGALAAGGGTAGALGVRELSRSTAAPARAAQDVEGSAPQPPLPPGAARVRAREALAPAASVGPAEPSRAGPASQHAIATVKSDGDAPLVAEVTAIDEARSAVARGDARGALRILDGYEQRFPRRHLAPEALYLRMQALHQLGDRAGARAFAGRLVSQYPTAPQVGRAQELLADPNQ